jgi:hypothetical protein
VNLTDEIQGTCLFRTVLLVIIGLSIASIGVLAYATTICGPDCHMPFTVATIAIGILTLYLISLLRAEPTEETEREKSFSEREQELAELDRRIAEYKRNLEETGKTYK